MTVSQNATTITPPLQRIGVYCAGNDGVRPAYRAQAVSLGTELAQRGIALVYGGGRTGLMGAIADAAMAAGGEVIGVMPHGLVQREVAHRDITHLHIVDSMHERKALMASMADAFITLPGGIGTLEEFFETWTWAQLGVHRKPMGLLDADGYWAPLRALLSHLGTEGFLRSDPDAWLVHAESAPQMIDALARFETPEVRRWLRLGET
ncbi:MAG: TIGR00730 family Rossman fold protein [Gemmatimonadaceae bacterium]|nr:TIGR00730 family Rossman fold protein [Gemmatimonadaceae bacterium]